MAYFPNGSSGDVLDLQCSDCPIHDDQPCPILFCQMQWNYSQLDHEEVKKMLTALVNDDGICRMKPLVEAALEHPKTKDKPDLEDHINDPIRPMPSMVAWAKAHGIKIK